MTTPPSTKLGPKTQELENALRARILDASCALRMAQAKAKDDPNEFQKATNMYFNFERFSNTKDYSRQEWAELVFAATKECNGVLPLSMAKLYEEFHRIDTVYKMSFKNKTFEECMEETQITQTPAHFQKFLQSTHPDTRQVIEHHYDASWKASNGQLLWKQYPTENTHGFLHYDADSQRHTSQKAPTQDDFPVLPTAHASKKHVTVKPATPKPVKQPKASWGNIPVKRIPKSKRRQKKGRKRSP